MHEDIQKLIDIAKLSGELTDRQREIILSKAEKLGEDVDEVEMLLETIKYQSPRKSENSARVKMRKCHNCGAIVPASAVKCPECGMVMESEADSSSQNRDYIAEIQREFKRIESRKRRKDEDEFDLDDNRHQEKMNVIRSFSVPFTKDAQIMAFNYAKARFEAVNSKDGSGYSEEESRAWLAKAQEFYNNVAAMSNLGESGQQWLKTNEGILHAKADTSTLSLFALGCLLPLIVFGVIAFFIAKGCGWL